MGILLELHHNGLSRRSDRARQGGFDQGSREKLNKEFSL